MKNELSTKISHHHIGGRDGSSPFIIPEKFKNDFLQILYDADEDCINQINQTVDSTITLPYCIGAKKSVQTFYINLDPYTSSLLKLNPKYKDFYYFTNDQHQGPLDYCYGDTVVTMEKRTVNTTSLDQLFDEQKHIPLPDILTLDTQGTEYEILTGSKKHLDNQILSIQLEVEFHEVYKNQKLFGDICQLLDQRGFIFIKFINIVEFSPYRVPIGLRSEGIHTFGEALFFRKIPEKKPNKITDEYLLQWFKQAFIAISYNQFEFGIKCLKLAKENVTTAFEAQMQGTNYFDFLNVLWEKVNQHPVIYPPLFSEKYNFKLSKERFETEYETNNLEKNFISMVDDIRQHLKTLNKKRLCIIPYGMLGRMYHDNQSKIDGVNVSFHDNNYEKINQQDSVKSPENITTEDYVLITTMAFDQSLLQQLTLSQKIPANQIISIRDLGTGITRRKNWFDSKTVDSDIEKYLINYGFEALAKCLANKRYQQSFDF